jgi:hypothetical protein
MITAKMTHESLDRLARTVELNQKEYRKQIRIVVNKAGTNLKSQWAKEISKHVAVLQRDAKQTLTVNRPPTSDASPKVKINQPFDRKIPLKKFKPKQTDSGVEYKISKKTSGSGKGSKGFIPGAFMGPKPGTMFARFGRGHVWARNPGEAKIAPKKGRYAGTKIKRQPIYKKYGPRLMHVTIANNIPAKLSDHARERLIYEINKRTRYLHKKRTGEI